MQAKFLSQDFGTGGENTARFSLSDTPVWRLRAPCSCGLWLAMVHQGCRISTHYDQDRVSLPPSPTMWRSNSQLYNSYVVHHTVARDKMWDGCVLSSFYRRVYTSKEYLRWRWKWLFTMRTKIKKTWNITSCTIDFFLNTQTNRK
jgi:hypothetical protein